MATVKWLGHASFLIQDGITIYIDPWKLKKSEPKADLILISHSHYDHFSEPDIQKIATSRTRIIGAADLKGKIKASFEPAEPGLEFTFNDVSIRTTPAYNTNKDFHPRSNGWLGFLITAGGETIYYAGDTDAIPEMSELGKVDLAMLPIGGKYTMTAEEAADAINNRIKPVRALPYHWGDIVGKPEDAQKFKKLCACPTEIQTP